MDVLHDHYKESFSHIREREKQRDRLFLVLVGLFALLIFEIQYPTNFEGSLGPVKASGATVDLGAFPLPGLLSVSWVLTFTIALRYCQTVVNIERQYGYLHGLEEKISRELGDEELYRREGRSYLEKYPLFQDWVWICYVFLLPAIVVLATLALVGLELAYLPHPIPHMVFDAVIAVAMIVSFYLYRLHPFKKTVKDFKDTLGERWAAWRRGGVSQQEHGGRRETDAEPDAEG